MEPSASAAPPGWTTILRSWRLTNLELATLACALLASSALLYVLVQAQERRQRRLPPGPRPWPILGNFPALSSRLPHRALKKLANQYGDVMYLRLGSSHCVVISSAAAAKEMTRSSNDANFSNRPKALLSKLLSDNYQTLAQSPHGPRWRQLRKFCSSELFSPMRHASYRGAREQELRNMMTLLELQSAKGEPVNVTSWLFELSVNVMTRMLINKRYFGSGGTSQEERDEIHRLFLTVLRVSVSANIGDFIPRLSFVGTLRGTDRLFRDIRDDALRTVGKMVELEKHRERAKERVVSDDDSYVPDFVDMISTAPLCDGTQPLPHRQQMLVLLELLLGGTETASTTIEWAMAELVGHPDLLKQAQEELNNVVGCRPMLEDDVTNLPILCTIVKETFRLHPPTPLGVPRASREVVEAWGYQIPANTRIMLNLHAIHRDPAFYTNPNAFIPQVISTAVKTLQGIIPALMKDESNVVHGFEKRFMNCPEVNALSGFDFYELIPFGVGRRMCPAVQLGNTMVHLILGNLLHNFQWSLPKGTTLGCFQKDNEHETFGISVSRQEPLRLVATSTNLEAKLTT